MTLTLDDLNRTMREIMPRVVQAWSEREGVAMRTLRQTGEEARAAAERQSTYEYRVRTVPNAPGGEPWTAATFNPTAHTLAIDWVMDDETEPAAGRPGFVYVDWSRDTAQVAPPSVPAFSAPRPVRMPARVVAGRPQGRAPLRPARIAALRALLPEITSDTDPRLWTVARLSAYGRYSFWVLKRDQRTRDWKVPHRVELGRTGLTQMPYARWVTEPLLRVAWVVVGERDWSGHRRYARVMAVQRVAKGQTLSLYQELPFLAPR